MPSKKSNNNGPFIPPFEIIRRGNRLCIKREGRIVAILRKTPKGYVIPKRLQSLDVWKVPEIKAELDKAVINQRTIKQNKYVSRAGIKTE